MSGIDHLVLCTHDLDAARARYQALGFTLTPKAVHPFGTGNSNIQMQGCFLELLAVMAPGEIPEHTPDRFSFAAHNRNFLNNGDGFSMLVMDSDDAAADQQNFDASGIKTYDPSGFSRKARLPSGEDVTVAFSMAFATDPLAPACGFFTCQQHAPEHFWKPAYQQHANTAHTVVEACLVSKAPDKHVQFLSVFTGSDKWAENDNGISLDTSRGRIIVSTPKQFEEVYESCAPNIDSGARFAGYTIGVSSASATQKCLDDNQLPYGQKAGRTLLAAEHAFGVAVAFEQTAS